MKPVYWYLCALAIVSLIAFVLYGVDKRRAKRGAWRIPERVLLGFSFFGGGIGGLLAMCAFRHKTKHICFWVVNVIGAAWQVAAAIALAVLL